MFAGRPGHCFLAENTKVFSRSVPIRNKMPILALTCDAVPDLFPLYASPPFAIEILRYGT